MCSWRAHSLRVRHLAFCWATVTILLVKVSVLKCRKEQHHFSVSLRKPYCSSIDLQLGYICIFKPPQFPSSYCIACIRDSKHLLEILLMNSPFPFSYWSVYQRFCWSTVCDDGHTEALKEKEKKNGMKKSLFRTWVCRAETRFLCAFLTSVVVFGTRAGPLFPLCFFEVAITK